MQMPTVQTPVSAKSSTSKRQSLSLEQQAIMHVLLQPTNQGDINCTNKAHEFLHAPSPNEHHFDNQEQASFHSAYSNANKIPSEIHLNTNELPSQASLPANDSSFEYVFHDCETFPMTTPDEAFERIFQEVVCDMQQSEFACVGAGIGGGS
jgi:hypothetical protein